MNPTIIASLIGAVTALIAAFIGLHRTKVETAKNRAELAKSKIEMLILLANLGKVVDENNERIRKIVWEATKPQYLDRLSRDLSNIRTGVPTAGKPLTLDDVYVWLELKAFGEEPLRDDEILNPNRDPCSLSPHIKVIGDPGGGKSTLLQRWAAGFVEHAKSEPDALMPIFVPLRMVAQYPAESLDLIDIAITYIFGTRHQKIKSMRDSVELNLQAGRTIVLLDGADEIPDSHRQYTLEAIQSLCNQHDKNIIVVTSRPSAYADSLVGFQTYWLQQFDEKQRDLLIQHWIPSSDEARHAKITDFVHQKSDQLFWENPLYLTMICALVTADRDLDIPSSGALFEQFIHLLLDTWPLFVKAASLKYPFMQKARILEIVADRMWSDESRMIQESHVLSLSALGNIPDLVHVLAEIDTSSGILHRDRTSYYKFLHPLFQEFFVARGISAKIARSSDPRKAESEFNASCPIGDGRYDHIQHFVQELLVMGGG